MREIVKHKNFLKDLKKIKRGFKESTRRRIEIRLEEAITKLAQDNKLDQSFKDHDLYNCKTFVDCRECHILGDLVLVYKKEDQEIKLLTLMRLGSHSEILERLTRQSEEN